MMVNDKGVPLHGRLTLSLETRSGELLARTERDFTIAELGSQTYPVSLEIPRKSGDCILKAVAQPTGQDSEATVCRRWTSVVE